MNSIISNLVAGLDQGLYLVLRWEPRVMPGIVIMTSRKLSYRALPAIAILTLGLLAAHAARADVQKGAQLARQWCANCHIIDGNTAGTVPQGPPSFPVIARSGMVPDQLRAFLSHPHGAMPDLALSRAEIDDLIGYIQSLH